MGLLCYHDDVFHRKETVMSKIFEDDDDDYLSNTIVLTDENGNDIEYEFLDLVEYDSEEYVVLYPVDDPDGDVVILKVDDSDEDSEEQTYLSVEDDDVLDKVFNIFKEKNKDIFTFTDE